MAAGLLEAGMVVRLAEVGTAAGLLEVGMAAGTAEIVRHLSLYKLSATSQRLEVFGYSCPSSSGRNITAGGSTKTATANF